MTITTITDPREADYQLIASLTDTFVVVDRYGHRSTFETLDDYGVFCAGISARKRTLYDTTKDRWVVGTILQLDDAR